MKKTQNPTQLRSIVVRLASVFAFAGEHRQGILAYWDHAVTGKLKGRTQFGFDVHKAHLKSIKNARRR